MLSLIIFRKQKRPPRRWAKKLFFGCLSWIVFLPFFFWLFPYRLFFQDFAAPIQTIIEIFIEVKRTLGFLL